MGRARPLGERYAYLFFLAPRVGLVCLVVPGFAFCLLVCLWTGAGSEAES